jgi:glycine/D-amino acid oxidase-like deaminating enzyme
LNSWKTDKSHGLWGKTAGAPPDLSDFKGHHTTDVAIIGGGYTGLSAAIHLAQNGCDATLLEAKSIGFGGSGRNAGFVNAGFWILPEDVNKAIGPEYGERLSVALGNSPDLVYSLIEAHGIECEALRPGTLLCAHAPSAVKDLEERIAQWKQRNAPVFFLDKNEVDSKTGSRSFYGAMLDKRAGTVQPLAYAYGLAKTAQKLGAKLFDNSPVTAVKQKGNGYIIETSKGTLNARAVILACQGYPDYGFRDQVKTFVPFYWFQFATRPLPEKILETILKEKQGVSDTHQVLSSYRLDNAGRLIIGSVGNLEGFAYNLSKKWVVRTIRKIFPQVDPIDLEYGWHGKIVMKTDHVPQFHIYGPDFVSVPVYNGRGIAPGTYFGKMLARFVLEGSKDIIPLPVSEQKPIVSRGVRGLYYEAGARLYHFIQHRT